MSPTPTAEENVAFRQSFYGRYCEWKGWAPFHFDRDQAETFRGELGPDLAGKSLLEIGFGAGGLIAWALAQGATVVGCEANAQCRDAASERGIELLPIDLGESVVAHKERFDYVVAFDVFEHLTLPQIVANLHQIAALLKPDGLLLLRFPNAQSPFGAFSQYGDVTHVTALSGAQMVQLALETPLEVVSVKAAYRPRGSTIGRRIVRAIRYLILDLLQAFVRFVFINTAPIDPVVTVRLRRRRDGKKK
jgi:2-polyprenyl-3-methyl-5-hydroxy-6-metoxy-1,4-benzoquinol methylase